MKKEKVIFFFPWREISGGPVYLSGLANALSRVPKYEVWYVDYTDGCSVGQLDRERVGFIPYSEPFFTPLDAEPLILVIPIYCASHIPPLHPDSRILFVNWHNYCVQALLDSWRLSQKDLQRFLDLVGRKSAECFVDRSHWLAQNQWCEPGCHPAAERYIPLVIRPRQYCEQTELIRRGEVHIAVLGRLCRDKIFSVLNLLEQLNQMETDRVRHLYVIGDGSEELLLRQAKTADRVHLHMMGTIVGDRLQNFLSTHTDVLFGMGLSVLEGAAIGLPAVVMPHNVVPFHLDAYALLQDCRGYATGWYDTQVTEMGISTHTAAEILEMVCAPMGKALLGRAALRYVEENHIDNLKAMERALQGTKLTASDFEMFRKDQGKIHLLGVPIAKLTTSFDESEKTVSFLGKRAFFQSVNTAEGKQFLLLGKKQNLLRARKEGRVFRMYLGNMRIPFLKL